ncbi:MAG: hypothetical protein ABIT91_25025 [Gemmatimonadaceae bacterium]
MVQYTLPRQRRSPVTMVTNSIVLFRRMMMSLCRRWPCVGDGAHDEAADCLRYIAMQRVWRNRWGWQREGFNDGR